MLKIKSAVVFLLTLLVTLTLAFFTHTSLLEKFGESRFGNQIVTSYCTNAALAALIYLVLYIFRRKLKNYIGYLFIGGSFLKFVIFFILFYPMYKSDGKMDRLEFAAFFVPYAIALVIETIFTIKMLKTLDKTTG